MAEKPARNHVWHELLHRRPVVPLVAKALHERLAAHLETRAILVQRKLEADLRVRLAQFRRRRLDVRHIRFKVLVHVAGIKLETVDAVVGLETLELASEPLRTERMGEIDKRARSVPPVDGFRGFAPVHVFLARHDKPALFAFPPRVERAKDHLAIAR